MQNRWRTPALLIALLVGAHVSTQNAGTQGATCLVRTVNGDIQGTDNGASCTFLGIPFGAPPIGNLRWKPPQLAAPWAPATFNANVLRQCPQLNAAGPAGNEDCLVLNVWVPHAVPDATTTGRPVLFWIHTGAFQGASINFADSNGRRLAERTGAIVVAANYRLGPFGFLGHPALTAEDPSYPSSGNYGFLDQRAAMAWVRDHIGAFGGDRDKVTIAGQSAGAHSVSLHLVSRGSEGYFTRAILQSGYASSRWRTRVDAESLGTDFAAAVGCTDPAQVIACMRGKTRNEVLVGFATGQQEYIETGRVAWGPVVDALDIPDQPRVLYETGQFNRVPTIIGATRDEGWIYVDRSFPTGLTVEQYEDAVRNEFGDTDTPALLAMYSVADFPSPKHALSQLAGDFEGVCEARRVARLIERTRTPVYLYSFERQVAAVAADQVIHGLDRNFLFGNNYGPPSNYVLNDDDLSLFGAISGYWTRLAETGDPNGGDSPFWPAFRRAKDLGRGVSKHIVLDWPISQGERLREAQCDFWEPFFLGSVVGSLPAAHPLSDLCGVTIEADLKLDHHLACSGNGLIVGADGIRIDLNGRTITGSGTGAGIDVAGRSGVTIVNGTIKNFGAGIQVASSTKIVIRGNVLADNTDGIDLQAGSHGNVIIHNTLQNNRSRGIMLRSGVIGNYVNENAFTGNRVGILLFGASGTTVQDNDVIGSLLGGIRFNVLATGNVVSGNKVTSNPAGIEFLVTPTGSAVGNKLAFNTITLNTCGLKGPTQNNVVGNNVLGGNGADRCD
jgi:para-nitrobenzyl esterase